MEKAGHLPRADAFAAVTGLAAGLFFGVWTGGALDPPPDPSSAALRAPGMKEAARAEDLAGEGRLDEALRVLGEAEESEGCRAAALLLRARRAVESDPWEALSALGDFLTLHPRSWRRWEAALLVARALDALGKREDAREALKTALMFEPKRLKRADKPIGRRGPWPGCTHAAWLALARMRFEDGAYSDAKEAAELVPEKCRGEIFAHSPQRPAALLLWAKAMAARGAPKTARAGLTELLQLFPDSPEAAEAGELIKR